MRILVTVPHATARAGAAERTSDRSARASAAILVATLEEKGFDVRLIVGDEQRDTCDLNRGAACDSSAHFKRAVQEAIEQWKLVFVLDAHSFPEQEHWRQTLAPDVAFLYDERFRPTSEAAAQFLRARGIDAVAIAGNPGENFIITRSARRSRARTRFD